MQDILQVEPMLSSGQVAPPSKATQKAQKKAAAEGDNASDCKSSTMGRATGRWTREEHYRFLEALKLHDGLQHRIYIS